MKEFTLLLIEGAAFDKPIKKATMYAESIDALVRSVGAQDYVGLDPNVYQLIGRCFNVFIDEVFADRCILVEEPVNEIN